MSVTLYSVHESLAEPNCMYIKLFIREKCILRYLDMTADGNFEAKQFFFF